MESKKSALERNAENTVMTWIKEMPPVKKVKKQSCAVLIRIAVPLAVVRKQKKTQRIAGAGAAVEVQGKMLRGGCYGFWG